MITISVPDMMCENCVKRITNALTAAELKFSVSPTGPASEQTGAGSVFLRRFYVTNLLLFLFFLQTFAQLDRVVFLQSGRHNTVTPTKT